MVKLPEVEMGEEIEEFDQDMNEKVLEVVQFRMEWLVEREWG